VGLFRVLAKPLRVGAGKKSSYAKDGSFWTCRSRRSKQLLYQRGQALPVDILTAKIQVVPRHVNTQGLTPLIFAGELGFYVRGLGGCFRLRGRGFCRRCSDELPRAFDASVATAIGQQAVVADFDEPGGQDVQGKGLLLPL